MAVKIRQEVKLGKGSAAFLFGVSSDHERDRRIYETGLEHERSSHDRSTFAGRVYSNLCDVRVDKDPHLPNRLRSARDA